MTRTATRHKAKHKQAVAKVKPSKKTSDTVIYSGIVLVGAFFVLLGWLFSPEYWRWFALGYIALMAYYMNISVMHIYRGKHIVGWKQALARLPLRTAGYGTRDGKPLEAAHGHPEVLRAMGLSLAVSVVVLAALAFVMLRLLK